MRLEYEERILYNYMETPRITGLLCGQTNVGLTAHSPLMQCFSSINVDKFSSKQSTGEIHPDGFIELFVFRYIASCVIMAPGAVKDPVTMGQFDWPDRGE